MAPQAPASDHPLSSGQAAMWATTQARGGGCYIEQILVRFTTPPDAAALEKAWIETVAQIPVLRVVITDRSARLTGSHQHPWINHEAAFPDEFSELLEKDRRTPFPANLTPSRCQYWPKSGVMLWTVHHAVLDGRSMTAILRHFLLHFVGTDPGPAPVWPGCLATDPAQSTAARDGLSAHAPAPREDEEPLIWSPGKPTPDEIPWYVRLSIAPELLDRLRPLAAELSTTLHGIVQWAWGWTLARIGGYDHSILGVVRSAHWSLPSDQASAGYLMATLPIPTRADGTLTLGEAIRHYREAVLAIRDFPLADPREAAAALGRPASHLWDSVIMTENHSLEESVRPHLPPGLIDSITIHERTGEPLTASAWLGAQAAIELEAMPGRFSLTATRHLAASWIKALELIATHPPGTPLASLDPLCDECLATLSNHESGGPALASDFGGIWQAFTASATRHAEGPARLRHGKITTYRDLTIEAESLAASLAAQGVSRGDSVASRLDDRGHAATVVLACARLQAVYMPFDADVPADRLAAMIRI
ncbi:MAG: condensation domain-containing protein, partial [Akkermansiaceae bacterium]|nr:condensation domain-containing protein [Akkermansiaceae bacterium]